MTNNRTPIGAGLALVAVALLLPTANAIGTTGLPVAVSASADTNGSGVGVGYAECDPLPTTCAADVAAAGEACADADGTLGIFSGSVHVCVQYGGAATASYARLILTAAETGESVVAWNEADENCYWNFSPPFYHCDASSIAHKTVSTCNKAQTASLSGVSRSGAKVIDLTSIIGQQYACTTGAGGSGSICFTAKASASARNDVFSVAPPTAEADGCSADSATAFVAQFAAVTSDAASTSSVSGEIRPFSSLPAGVQQDLVDQVKANVQRDLASSTVLAGNPELQAQAQQALLDAIVGGMESQDFDVAVISVQ